MSILSPEQFPLDLTGTNPRNLVQNEVREFPTINERIFIPAGGVYYSDTLVIYDSVTGRRLAPITDYKCYHINSDACLASGKQACCVIFVSAPAVSKVKFSYQAVGGEYNNMIPTLKEIVAGIDYTSLTRISWGSQIYGKPESYPAGAHFHPGTEFGDWKRFHVVLTNIYWALINKDTAAWQSVYNYIDANIANAMSNIEVPTLDLNAYYTRDEINQIIAPMNGRMTGLEDSVNAHTLTITNIQESITTINESIVSLGKRIDGIKPMTVSPKQGNILQSLTDGFYVPPPPAATTVTISAATGNQISQKPDGWFVPAPPADDPEPISADSGNQISRRTDGLFVPAPPTVDLTGLATKSDIQTLQQKDQSLEQQIQDLNNRLNVSGGCIIINFNAYDKYVGNGRERIDHNTVVVVGMPRSAVSITTTSKTCVITLPASITDSSQVILDGDMAAVTLDMTTRNITVNADVKDYDYQDNGNGNGWWARGSAAISFK